MKKTKNKKRKNNAVRSKVINSSLAYLMTDSMSNYLDAMKEYSFRPVSNPTAAILMNNDDAIKELPNRTPKIVEYGRNARRLNLPILSNGYLSIIYNTCLEMERFLNKYYQRAVPNIYAKDNKKKAQKKALKTITDTLGEDFSAPDEIVDILSSAYSKRNELKYEDIDIDVLFQTITVMEICIVSYRQIENSDRFNELTPSQRKDIDEIISSLTDRLYKMFFVIGFESNGTWCILEEDLQKAVDPNYLFFANNAVEFIKNELSNNDEILKEALTDTVFKWIHKEIVSGASIDNSNYKNYLKKHLYEDEKELSKFIVDAYTSYRNTFYKSVICRVQDKWYTISDTHNTQLQEDLKRFKKGYYANEKQIEKLKKSLEKEEQIRVSLSSERDEAVRNLKSSVQNAVKNATKEQADENAALRKKLKEAGEETKKLNLQIEELRAEAATSDEDDAETADIAFDLSSYLKIRDKRIVFVRSKYSETFSVFSEIEKAFPNAKFVDAISDDFNAKATDCVVFMTKCMKHYTYWDMKNSSKAGNVPFVHCNYQNLGMVNKTICEALLE